MVLYSFPGIINPLESPVRKDPEVHPRKRGALMAGIFSVESLAAASIFISEHFSMLINSVKTLMFIKLSELIKYSQNNWI